MHRQPPRHEATEWFPRWEEAPWGVYLSCDYSPKKILHPMVVFASVPRLKADAKGGKREVLGLVSADCRGRSRCGI